MKTTCYLVASVLLILSLLSNVTQGIRLLDNEMKIVDELLQIKRVILESVETAPLRDQEGFRKITPPRKIQYLYFLSGMNNRKLLTTNSSPHPSTAITRNGSVEKEANLESMEKNDDLRNNSEPISETLEGDLEHYPDLVDIAEMDYSPAKRKPPIHN